MIGSESIGFSGSQFRFVVETLNNAAGELAFGPEPVQQQRSVAPQLTGHFLNGLNLRSHRPGTPSVQERARPIGRFIGPEQLKLFFQLVAPDRLQIVAQKLRQPELLLRSQILWQLKEQPVAIVQYRLIVVTIGLPGLLGTFLVIRLAQVRHDVKPIENMNRMAPDRPKRPGHILPAQPLGPARQKPDIGLGQLMFARCPEHTLYPNTTAPAAHPVRGVDEEHLDAPHWDRLKTALQQRVMDPSSPSAAGADGPAVGPGVQFRLNRRFAGAFHPAHRTVHKRFEILQAVQDSLDVNPVVFPLSGAWSHSYHYRVRGQAALLPVRPAFCRIPVTPGYFLTHKFS